MARRLNIVRGLSAARDWVRVGRPGERRATLILYNPGAGDVWAQRRRSGRKTDRDSVGPKKPLAGYLTAARGQLLQCDQSLRVGLCNAR